MGRPRQAAPPAEIDDLLARIQEWRSTRKSGAAYPEGIWSETVDLAKRFGINPVCRALGLSYTDLKKRMGSVHTLRRLAEPVKSTFVELDGGCFPAGGIQVGPVLEVSSPDGARMVLRMPTGASVDPCVLVASFLGRGR